VDAPENDRNASMPEQVKLPNPWRKMMMMIFIRELYKNLADTLTPSLPKTTVI
jgi:hypothetical protein